MADKRDLINSQNTGFFQDLIQRVKLIYRLMADRRVNFFLKLLPVAAVVYLVSPLDLVPGLALPVIGALDDAAVLWLGTGAYERAQQGDRHFLEGCRGSGSHGDRGSEAARRGIGASPLQ